MTPLDWIIVVFCLAMAVWGYQQGLIVGALTLVGFVAGAFAGSRIAPALLEEGSKSPYAPLVTLLGGLLLGGIAAIGMEGIARALHGRLVRGRAGFAIDGAGGAVLFAALGLAIAWLFGAVALNTPGPDRGPPSVQRSEILSRLNDSFPPSGRDQGAQPDRRDAGDQGPGGRRSAAGPGDRRRSRGRRPPGPSVVRVLGTACGLGVSGSGWVAAPGIIATNAHVIAGQDDTTVTTQAGARVRGRCGPLRHPQRPRPAPGERPRRRRPSARRSRREGHRRRGPRLSRKTVPTTSQPPASGPPPRSSARTPTAAVPSAAR